MTETTEALSESELPNGGSETPISSFSIWPPSEKTRQAVRDRLTKTFSTQTLLTKKYGELSNEEGQATAKRIEGEAFDLIGSGKKSLDEGFDCLQAYSKEISKRVMETMKSRSGVKPAADKPASQDVDTLASGLNSVDLKEDDGSSAPPHSDKTESTAGDD